MVIERIPLDLSGIEPPSEAGRLIAERQGCGWRRLAKLGASETELAEVRRGVGYIDANLLASVCLDGSVLLWILD